MTTSDRWATWQVDSQKLMAEFWPGHPPAEVLYHTIKPAIIGGNVAASYGPADNSSWAAGVFQHIMGMPAADDVVLLMLGDQGLCGPARVDQIDAAAKAITDNPDIGCVPLAWVPTTAGAEKRGPLTLLSRPWRPWKLVPTLWRRGALALAVGSFAAASPLSFESLMSGPRSPSRFRVARLTDMPVPPPPGSAEIHDLDKTGWPLPYLNLWTFGKPNPQHALFLRKRGIEQPDDSEIRRYYRLPEWKEPANYNPANYRLDSAGRAGCGCKD